MMKFTLPYSFLLFGVFHAQFLFACNLAPSSDWFQSTESIALKTDQVFVGEAVSVLETCVTDGPVNFRNGKVQRMSGDNPEGCYVYSFKVLRPIRGTYKSGDIVQVRGRLKGRNNEKITYTKDCKILVGFNVSEFYLIFKDAFHAKAYRKIASKASPEVEKIVRILK